MNLDTDQLSETFAAHEHLAPDALEVMARAKRIARTYQRRRWAVRATGGAVLGAGLVAGGIALPGRAGHAASGSVARVNAAGDPSSSATPPAANQAQDLAAYFAAGYDYNDAVQLAQLWNESASASGIGQVKAEAGQKLLEGQKLPIPPSSTPESAEPQSVAAFFAAGYTYNDAVTLAGIWKETDTYKVKGQAGQKLLDGQKLPIPPSDPGGSGTSAGSSSGTTFVLSSRAAKKASLARKFVVGKAGSGRTSTAAAETPQQASDIQAFFGAGYTYDDAVQLGKIWNETDTFRVKIDAGQKLLDGQTLPVQPSGTPESQSEKAQAAYFAAGYTYDDAVKLGKIWNQTDTNQIKTEAGQKLLDGQTLPIAP
jgi:hypothetical protein